MSREKRVVVWKDAVGLKSLPKGVTSAWGGTKVYERVWTAHVVEEVLPGENPTGTIWFREGKQWLETEQMKFGAKKALDTWVKDTGLETLENPPTNAEGEKPGEMKHLSTPVGRALPAEEFFSRETIDKVMKRNLELWEDTVEAMALRTMTGLQTDDTPIQAVARAYRVDEARVRQTPIMLDVLKRVKTWMENPPTRTRSRPSQPLVRALNVSKDGTFYHETVREGWLDVKGRFFPLERGERHYLAMLRIMKADRGIAPDPNSTEDVMDATIRLIEKQGRADGYIRIGTNSGGVGGRGVVIVDWVDGPGPTAAQVEVLEDLLVQYHGDVSVEQARVINDCRYAQFDALEYRQSGETLLDFVRHKNPKETSKKRLGFFASSSALKPPDMAHQRWLNRHHAIESAKARELEYAKERAEHPSLPESAVRQIVEDHVAHSKENPKVSGEYKDRDGRFVLWQKDLKIPRRVRAFHVTPDPGTKFQTSVLDMHTGEHRWVDTLGVGLTPQGYVKVSMGNPKENPGRNALNFFWAAENSKLVKTLTIAFNQMPVATCPAAGVCRKYCFGQRGFFGMTDHALRLAYNTLARLDPMISGPLLKPLRAVLEEGFEPKNNRHKDVARAAIRLALKGFEYKGKTVPVSKVRLDPKFADKVIADLEAILVTGAPRTGMKPRSVRINDVGDFDSQAYVDAWVKVAKHFAGRLHFYAYTKSYHRFDFSRFPKGFILVKSFGGQDDKFIDTAKDYHALVFFGKKTHGFKGLKPAEAREQARLSARKAMDELNAKRRKRGLPEYAYGSDEDLPSWPGLGKPCPRHIGLMPMTVLAARAVECAASTPEGKEFWMKRATTNPIRPPRDWFKRCIAGVSRHGGSVDPRRVCGSLWHHKMGPGAKRRAMELENPPKKWSGPAEKCDICGSAFTDFFVDGKTVFGPWALMCPTCHGMKGCGLGLGLGQKYDAKTKERRNPPEMSCRPDPILVRAALSMVMNHEHNADKRDYLKTLIESMDPRRLSVADRELLLDIIGDYTRNPNPHRHVLAAQITGPEMGSANPPNPKGTTEQPVIEGSNSMDENDWEYMVETLTGVMRGANKSNRWHVEVKNFGWQSLSGHKDITAQTGKELLSAILPNTECHFKVYERKGYIAINNAHHDSPTWAEWYYVFPEGYKNPPDETEDIRREMLASHVPGERADLEDRFGQVWDTSQVREEFEVLGFMAPFCVVRRRADGVKGSLMFQHSPRYYFSFTADNPKTKKGTRRHKCIRCGGTGSYTITCDDGEREVGCSCDSGYTNPSGSHPTSAEWSKKFLAHLDACETCRYAWGTYSSDRDVSKMCKTGRWMLGKTLDNPGLLPDACPARDVEAGAPHIYRQGFCSFCGQPAPEVAAGKGWPRYQEARWAGDKGRWVYNPPEPAKDKNGANGYIVYWDKTHKSYEVYADSSYGACKKLAEQLGAKKGTVGMSATLAEKGGEQVTTFLTNGGECPVCGGPGWGAGEICMECVRARHRGAVTHRCSCGKKRQPRKVDLGFRRYTACDRCLGVISQENPRAHTAFKGTRSERMFIAPKPGHSTMTMVYASKGKLIDKSRVEKLYIRDNPPGSTLIGRKCLTIETTSGKCQGNMGAVHGLKGGAVLVKGVFTKLPSGRVKALWYADEAKAKREKMSNPRTPWKHDFSSEDVSISRCRGGILLRGKRPLWGMR